MTTKIEWAEETWNPVTGCTKISAGCQHCYAERMAKRLAGRCGYSADDPFRVTYHPDKLEQPLVWRKPRRIFVCSMGDVFHEDVDSDFISAMFVKMAVCHWHTFLVLTKRPERMFDFYKEYGVEPKNIWLGVTAENQDEADRRIPVLLQTPAAVRFVSIEPMLGAVDLTQCRYDGVIDIDSLNGIAKGVYNEYPFPSKDLKSWPLDWVICGGETGPGARELIHHPEWVYSLRDQCMSANVPFFFKKWGNNKVRKIDGVEWNQYPEVNQ